MSPDIDALPVPAAQLGESPFWWPEQGALYWCDIAGRALHRWVPSTAQHTRWDFDSDVGCAAPQPGGRLLLALRSGIVRFDPKTGTREQLAAPPYDPALQRFNDGKADAQGRFWVGTLCEPREPALASLYRFDGGRIERIAGDISVSNGLAWSPDGRTLYWADTQQHSVFAFDFDGRDGSLSRRRVFACFPKRSGAGLEGYGGRPDGAAVDAEGHYWVAMYEGQRLLRLAPDGAVSADIALPVRCPTMPCFGGPDLKTLYVTSASARRPADELAAQPLAGRVLQMRVPVPGLPVNFARP